LLRERVEKKLKKNRVEEVIGRLAVVLFLALVVSGFGWIVYIFISSSPTQTVPKKIDKSQLFYTTTDQYDDGLELRTEHYHGGPTASESFYKNGHRHQNSESYYQTGEQFRSALYYYDTLVTEVYFYKNGDTIKNFPTISDNEIHHITLLNREGTRRIKFQFYDFKVVKGSYQEFGIEK
jgi:hypothetical protein